MTLDRRFALLFGGIVAAVYAAAFALARLLPSLERPDPVAVGMTLDMVVVVPLAFYGLVARRRGLSIVALAPVVVLSVVAANLIVPRDHQRALRVLETLVVPLELGFVSWIGWRAAKALRRARRDAASDPVEQLHHAAFELLRKERVAAIVASEIAVLYYAFGAWRARPHVIAGWSAITHHDRSGHAGIVLALLIVVGVEAFPVHVLIASWSAMAAWVMTILSVWSAVWLIADYRATVLRPVLIGDEEVWIRAGLRWSARVPRDQILEIVQTEPDSGKQNLKLTLLAAPTHWIMLREPVLVQGPYGFRRRARALGLAPDAPERIRELLSLPRGRVGEARDPA